MFCMASQSLLWAVQLTPHRSNIKALYRGPYRECFSLFHFLYSTSLTSEVFGLPALSFTAAVCFLAVSDKRDPFVRLCATRPLVFIGEISYSIYLLQWLVWIGWKHVIAKLPLFSSHPYLMVAAAATSLIILSVVSYYCFEKPARSWLRRHLS